MANNYLPIQQGELSLYDYIRAVRAIPMLETDEEYILAKDYTTTGNKDAAHKMVTSHLKLVVKVAMGYRGYGLPLGDIISEGNIGLMTAVKKFDPEKGFRLATYAMFWIKANINEYVLKSWSLVKISSSNNQKKLFFNLRRLKSKIAAFSDAELHPSQVCEIAHELNVPEKDVITMNQRMSSRDSSLNAPIKSQEGETEWQNWLPDSQDVEEEFAKTEDLEQKRKLLAAAMQQLTPREKEIIYLRRINAKSSTLENLSNKFNVSKERIRQIEIAALNKLRNYVIDTKQISSN